MQKKIAIYSLVVLTSLNALGTEEIVVSATKTPQHLQDITSSVEIITKEQLEERHFASLSDALDSISGITFNRNGGIGSSTSMFIRGMDSDKILVLIDGNRYRDPTNTNGAHFAQIDISSVERIEIIKGAQSGIWGADASSGVINIITKKPKDGLSLALNLETGSFNTKSTSTSISYKDELYYLLFSASKVESDGFSAQILEGGKLGDFEDDGYSRDSFLLKGGIYIDDTSTLESSYKYSASLSEYDSFANPDDSEQKSSFENHQYSTSYKKEISNHNIELKLFGSLYNRDELGAKSSDFGESIKIFRGSALSFEALDRYRYTKGGELIFGGGVAREEIDLEKTDRVKSEQSSEGFYAFITNSNRFEKLILTQSIRYDSYERFDDRVSGKIGAKYMLGDYYISSNIGSAYNIPNMMEELNPWGEANMDLNPEDSISLDLTFGYKNAKITYFENRVDNLIEWSGGGFENIEGRSTFKGVELSADKAIGEKVVVGVDYTKLDAKDREGKRLARRASDEIAFSVDYYDYDFHLNLLGQYVGDRIEYDYMGEIKAQSGEYFLAHSTINFEPKKGVLFFLKVQNIFDKKYALVDGYATPPRSFYLGSRFQF